MSAVNWNATLVTLGADISPIASLLRSKISQLGALYDANGSPDVLRESSDHEQWRLAYAAQLALRDRAAARIDGKPPTPIDPSNPSAVAQAVANRITAALATASPAVSALIADLSLPAEPSKFYGANYYAGFPGSASINGFTTLGQLQSALVAVIAEASAYLAVRG